MVPVDADGSFCVYHQRSVDLISDVQGYFGSPSAGQSAVLPQRAGACARHSRHRHDPAPSGARRWRRAGRDRRSRRHRGRAGQHHHGRRDGGRVHHRRSLLGAGRRTRRNDRTATTWSARAVSNLSVIPVDADGSFCIYHQRPVHLTVDVQGEFAADTAGLGMTINEPERVLDTRQHANHAGSHRCRSGRDRCQRRHRGGAGQHHDGRRRHAAATSPPTAARTLTRWTAGVLERQPPGRRRRRRTSAWCPSMPTERSASTASGPVQLTVDLQGIVHRDGERRDSHLVPPTRVLDTRPPPSALPGDVVHLGRAHRRLDLGRPDLADHAARPGRSGRRAVPPGRCDRPSHGDLAAPGRSSSACPGRPTRSRPRRPRSRQRLRRLLGLRARHHRHRQRRCRQRRHRGALASTR